MVAKKSKMYEPIRSQCRHLFDRSAEKYKFKLVLSTCYLTSFIKSIQQLQRRSWKCASQQRYRVPIFADGLAKNKLCKGHCVLAVFNVLSKSTQLLQRRTWKCVRQKRGQGGHFCWRITQMNTKLVRRCWVLCHILPTKLWGYDGFNMTVPSVRLSVRGKVVFGR